MRSILQSSGICLSFLSLRILLFNSSKSSTDEPDRRMTIPTLLNPGFVEFEFLHSQNFIRLQF